MKKKRLFIVVMVVLLTVMSLPLQAEAAAKAPKKLKLNKKSVTLYVGETYKLKAKVSPKKANKKVKWKSSNKKVVTVTSKGKIKAKKAGKATITCTSKAKKKVKAKCKITVLKGTNPNNSSKTSADQLLLENAKLILSRTCEPLYLGNKAGSKTDKNGNYLWRVGYSQGIRSSIDAYKGENVYATTECSDFGTPLMTYFGNATPVDPVNTQVRNGTYDFAYDPYDVVLGWSMWDSKTSQDAIEKRFHCSISNGIYNKLIEYSNKASGGSGKCVMVIYGKNKQDVLTARYAGFVSWGFVSNAASYSFIGVAPDNAGIYGKTYSGNIFY